MRPHRDRGHGVLPGRRGPEHGAPVGGRPQAGQLWGWAVIQWVGLRRLCFKLGNNCKHFNIINLYADEIVI